MLKNYFHNKFLRLKGSKNILKLFSYISDNYSYHNVCHILNLNKHYDNSNCMYFKFDL